MNLTVPCPFTLERQELAKEKEDAEAFNEMRQFWASVFGWIFKDGWVSHERYAEALELFTDIRNMTLNHLTGTDREAFMADTAWIETSRKRL